MARKYRSKDLVVEVTDPHREVRPCGLRSAAPTRSSPHNAVLPVLANLRCVAYAVYCVARRRAT